MEPSVKERFAIVLFGLEVALEAGEVGLGLRLGATTVFAFGLPLVHAHWRQATASASKAATPPWQTRSTPRL
jgi:hypothetical protein